MCSLNRLECYKLRRKRGELKKEKERTGKRRKEKKEGRNVIDIFFNLVNENVFLPIHMV